MYSTFYANDKFLRVTVWYIFMSYQRQRLNPKGLFEDAIKDYNDGVQSVQVRVYVLYLQYSMHVCQLLNSLVLFLLCLLASKMLSPLSLDSSYSYFVPLTILSRLCDNMGRRKLPLDIPYDKTFTLCM